MIQQALLEQHARAHWIINFVVTAETSKLIDESRVSSI